MNKWIVKGAVVALVFVLLFFLLNEKNVPGTIRIHGSTTLEPLMQKVATEYPKDSKTQISVKAVGSKDGIDSLISGACDIAMSSMEIQPEQISHAADKGMTIKPFLLGYDIIVPIVHPANPLTDISFENLKKVYDGSVTNWSILGGRDTAIDVVDRTHVSGTYNVWHHTVGPEETNDSQYTVQPSNSAVLAYVSEHVNAIGYVSAAYLNPEVKPLKLDGIAMADNDSLLSKYHLKRPLFLYINEANFNNAIKQFVVHMIINERGRELLREAGFFYNAWAGKYPPELPRG
ncbi:MAG: phosphate ABC transporter substrate-binding protein [Phycisphaeraceae bacterium]|nr:phosphate ABC transporter substrate-binding protein [Phycisphaeraceae bacterium]